MDRSRLGWGSVLCRFSEPGVSAFAAPTEISRSRDGIVACGRKWRFGEEYATAWYYNLDDGACLLGIILSFSNE